MEMNKESKQNRNPQLHKKLSESEAKDLKNLSIKKDLEKSSGKLITK